jgi:hypothetical protein
MLRELGGVLAQTANLHRWFPTRRANLPVITAMPTVIDMVNELVIG